jgi:chemotaxis signal transduction protein
MTIPAGGARKSFVLFSLGTKRFALPAEGVVELVGTSFLHTFQHSDPLLLGVLLKRGRVVPVWDVARLLTGQSVADRKFHLIARHRIGENLEWTALPVDAGCEIIPDLEPFPASAEHPAYVCALLLLLEEFVEVLDLERLAASMPGIPGPASAGPAIGEQMQDAEVSA